MKFNDITYQQIQMDQYESEFNEILSNIENAPTFEVQDAALVELHQKRDEFDTMYQLANIRFDLNTADESYKKEVAHFNEISPRFDNLLNQSFALLNRLKFKDQIAKKRGQHIFNRAEYTAAGFNPVIMEDKVLHNQLSTEYTTLKSKAKIMFQGKEHNLSQLDKYFFDNDRSVREEAQRAYWKFFSDHQEEFDDLFDRLVKCRHQMALKMGCKNFVELGYQWMLRLDYNQEMVANFRKQIAEEIVPITQELRKRQKARLGYDSLEYYDLSYHFLSGNPSPKGTPEDTIRQAKEMYEALSQETGDFFNYMIDHELLDLVSRKNKNDGGYCWAVSNYKHPFIFANFNGTLDDIRVLTHEAGHAFQYFKSRFNDLIEYINPSHETAEIHAMSMEFLTYPWMKNFFKEDTEKYFFSHLNNSLLFLPYGTAIDHFQHVIYENPHFTPDERAEAWKEMEKLYLPDRKMDMNPYLESGRAWQKIMHIYRLPFYGIDYVLAQISAFQFWQKANKDRKGAWKDYVNLCNAGGTKPYLELLKVANLNSPFEDGSVKRITGEMMEYLNGFDDGKF